MCQVDAVVGTRWGSGLGRWRLPQCSLEHGDADVQDMGWGMSLPGMCQCAMWLRWCANLVSRIAMPSMNPVVGVADRIRCAVQFPGEAKYSYQNAMNGNHSRPCSSRTIQRSTLPRRRQNWALLVPLYPPFCRSVVVLGGRGGGSMSGSPMSLLNHEVHEVRDTWGGGEPNPECARSAAARRTHEAAIARDARREDRPSAVGDVVGAVSMSTLK